MLDLQPTKQKVKLVKACFTAVENPNKPFPQTVKETNGSRLGWGKSWMGEAETSKLQVWQLTNLEANQVMGQSPKPIPALLGDPPVRKHGKALSKMVNRK